MGTSSSRPLRKVGGWKQVKEAIANPDIDGGQVAQLTLSAFGRQRIEPIFRESVASSISDAWQITEKVARVGLKVLLLEAGVTLPIETPVTGLVSLVLAQVSPNLSRTPDDEVVRKAFVSTLLEVATRSKGLRLDLTSVQSNVSNFVESLGERGFLQKYLKYYIEGVVRAQIDRDTSINVGRDRRFGSVSDMDRFLDDVKSFSAEIAESITDSLLEVDARYPWKGLPLVAEKGLETFLRWQRGSDSN